MEPTEQPTEPGVYFATPSHQKEYPAESQRRECVLVQRSCSGQPRLVVHSFFDDCVETHRYCNYVKAIDPLAETVDPLAIKCGWYWANRVGQSNWRQVVRVVEHCDSYGDEPRLVVATAGCEKVCELTEFEQFDPLAEAPK